MYPGQSNVYAKLIDGVPVSKIIVLPSLLMSSPQPLMGHQTA